MEKNQKKSWTITLRRVKVAKTLVGSFLAERSTLQGPKYRSSTVHIVQGCLVLRPSRVLKGQFRTHQGLSRPSLRRVIVQTFFEKFFFVHNFAPLPRRPPQRLSSRQNNDEHECGV